jgi:hypothetical protein
MNERDYTLPNWNGHLIEWNDWDNYMPNLICRCAMKAKKDGYKYFGLQFYGMLFYSLQICIYKYFINISSTGSFVIEY